MNYFSLLIIIYQLLMYVRMLQVIMLLVTQFFSMNVLLPIVFFIFCFPLVKVCEIFKVTYTMTNLSWPIQADYSLGHTPLMVTHYYYLRFTAGATELFWTGTEWSSCKYKQWTGTVWSSCKYKQWTGTEWSSCKYKQWTGTEWSSCKYKQHS